VVFPSVSVTPQPFKIIFASTAASCASRALKIGMGGPECYVFTGLSYLIALPDSLSLGLSFFLLISHPIHGVHLVLPDDLLIRSCDLLSHLMTFYHDYNYY
jgi:hypothetical protein